MQRIIDLRQNVANEDLAALRNRFGDDIPSRILDEHLMKATKWRDLEAMKSFIEAGANVNVCNALHVAASDGHFKFVSFLIEAGADVNLQDSYGATALDRAHECNHTDIVALLIKAGSVNVNLGWLLTRAAENGDVDKVESLLKAGARVHAQNFGFSALHAAARAGYSKIVSLLIQSGAEVDLQSPQGDTALHFAANNGHVEIVSNLINMGAKVNLQNRRGDTALHYAAKHESHYRFGVADGNFKEIVCTLINAGADVNLRDQFGGSALHVAAKHGNVATMSSLIEAGAEVNAQDHSGSSPLHAAAMSKNSYRNVDAVSILIDAGAKSFENQEGDKAIHYASRRGRVEIVQFLIKIEANVNSQNKYGYTPLHVASQHGHTEVVRLLLENRADSRLKTNLNLSEYANIMDFEDYRSDAMPPARNDVTPLALTFNTEIMLMLIRAGSPTADVNEVLHRAADAGNLTRVNLLIDAGAEVNWKNENGMSALQFAAKNRHEKVVHSLIAAGAEINAQNKDGNSALHFAAMNGQKEIVCCLIAAGAEVNAQNKDGNSALHIAADHRDFPSHLVEANAQNEPNKHKDVVFSLVKAGAEVNLQNKKGMAALHCAAVFGRAEIASFLIDAGADANLKNKRGNTATSIAAFKGHLQLIQLLIEAGGYIGDLSHELLKAAETGALEKVKQLINVGAKINFVNKQSALHLAAMNGHVKVVSFLVDSGADVNTPNDHGRTALSMAAQNNHVQIASLLIDAGGDVKWKSNRGWTALHYAAFSGHAKMISFLIEKNACVFATNEDGHCPMDLIDDRRLRAVFREKVQTFLEECVDWNENLVQELAAFLC